MLENSRVFGTSSFALQELGLRRGHRPLTEDNTALSVKAARRPAARIPAG